MTFGACCLTDRPFADRFDTLMRFNTVLLKFNTCCHDFFTHRLHPGVHYVVSMARHAAGVVRLQSAGCSNHTMLHWRA